MGKRPRKRAKPTVRTADGKIQQFDGRKLQALFVYNQLNCTQTELAQFFNVSLNTMNTWLKDANALIDDGNIVEMAKARFYSMVPKALDVYHQALKLGAVMPDASRIGAAKDVLKERGVITDKQILELEVVTKDDKELEDEIARIVADRFKPINPGGSSQN